MKRAIHLVFAVGLAAAGCATTPKPTALPAITNVRSPAVGIVTGGRLSAADLPTLRGAGIRQIIDLTPDAETPGFDEAGAMRSAGIAYSNLPLAGASDLTPANVRTFDVLLRDAKRPVLVHCASGNRVGAMAALRAAWVDGRTPDEALAIGRAWGLKGLEPEVRKRLEGPAAPPAP